MAGDPLVTDADITGLYPVDEAVVAALGDTKCYSGVLIVLDD